MAWKLLPVYVLTRPFLAHSWEYFKWRCPLGAQQEIHCTSFILDEHPSCSRSPTPQRLYHVSGKNKATASDPQNASLAITPRSLPHFKSLDTFNLTVTRLMHDLYPWNVKRREKKRKHTSTLSGIVFHSNFRPTFVHDMCDFGRLAKWKLFLRVVAGALWNCRGSCCCYYY